MLQVIKAEEVRDGEPRIWIETPQPVMHTESRRDRGCQPCGFAIVDRPAPTPAADPLATVRAALDAMSTHATGPWPAEIVVQVLNAAPAIAELCAEAERLRGDNLNLHPDLDAARALLATATAELAAARAVPADVEALIKEVTDGALEAGSCSALGHTYSLTKDPTWTVPRLKAAIARAISEARAAAPSTVGGLLAAARCSCTHEAGDSRCDAHPSCSECGAASARPVDGCEACRGTLSKGG